MNCRSAKFPCYVAGEFCTTATHSQLLRPHAISQFCNARGRSFFRAARYRACAVRSAPRFASKLVPQGELHLSRRRRLLKFTERQWRCEREAWVGEVHCVECIERLRPKADPLSFLRKLEGFLQHQIRVEIGRQPDSRP